MTCGCSMRKGWCCLRTGNAVNWVSMAVFMPLPNQIEGPVPLAREQMYRLPHPLLLRALCRVPRIQRAQEPRLRHGNRSLSSYLLLIYSHRHVDISPSNKLCFLMWICLWDCLNVQDGMRTWKGRPPELQPCLHLSLEAWAVLELNWRVGLAIQLLYCCNAGLCLIVNC